MMRMIELRLVRAELLLLVCLCTASAEGAPFFFVQISDPQLGMYAKNGNFAQETANLEFTVATVNRLKPEFVVVTGDLINRPADPDQLAEYKRIIAQISPSIPVHQVAGNHDVGAAPTPVTLQAWKNQFGPDHYSFRHKGLVGIVLNSSIIFAPQKAQGAFEEQELWLRSELEKARGEHADHTVVFQHHPWFLQSPDEPDQYFNIPKVRRSTYLALFREFSVRYLFCGHYHRNAIGKDADVEVITTGPVGKPLGEGKSGTRIVIVHPDRLEHRFYDFGELPNKIDLTGSETNAN